MFFPDFLLLVQNTFNSTSLCVCVCVCACARARVHVCVFGFVVLHKRVSSEVLYQQESSPFLLKPDAVAASSSNYRSI